LARLGKEKRAVVIPQDVLTELLAKGPNELLLIDTVYKAAKANIKLIGGSVPDLNHVTLCNVCEMLHADPREFDFNNPPTQCSAKKVDRRGSQIWLYGYGAELSEYCVAKVPGAYGRRFSVYLKIVPSRNARLSDDYFHNWLPYWYLYSPATKIGHLQ
jgi:hypothetical protein